MFSFDWIVLQKKQIKNNKSIISIFSKEYWKISAWITESKKKTSVDLWNVYNFSSNIENTINKIDWIKTKIIIKTENLGYDEINNILQILAFLEKIMPSWVVTESIYNDYIEITKSITDKSLNNKICAFFVLRLIKKLWIAKTPTKWKDKDNLVKIFSVIEKYNIETLMKISWITKEDINEINNYNTNTLINYIN